MLTVISRRSGTLVKEKAAARVITAANFHGSGAKGSGDGSNGHSKGFTAALVGAASVGVAAGAYLLQQEKDRLKLHASDMRKRPPGFEIPGLRTYTMSEVGLIQIPDMQNFTKNFF